MPNQVPEGPEKEDAAVKEPPAMPVRAKTYAEAAAERPSILLGADFVYVMKGPPGRALTPEYAGPYQVVER